MASTAVASPPAAASGGATPPLPSGSPPVIKTAGELQTVIHNLLRQSVESQSQDLARYLNMLNSAEVQKLVPGLTEDYARVVAELKKTPVPSDAIQTGADIRTLVVSSAALYKHLAERAAAMQSILRATIAERDAARAQAEDQGNPAEEAQARAALEKQLSDEKQLTAAAQTALQRAEAARERAEQDFAAKEGELRQVQQELAAAKASHQQAEASWTTALSEASRKQAEFNREAERTRQERDRLEVQIRALTEEKSGAEGQARAFEQELARERTKSLRLEGEKRIAEERANKFISEDARAAELAQAERTIAALRAQLRLENSQSAALSRDALDAVQVLQDTAVSRRAAPQVPGAYSRTQLDALQQALSRSIASIDAQNESLVRTMESILVQGASNPAAIRELNRLRTTLAGANGGRVISTQQDGTVTWAFPSTRDAARVQAALKHLGFDTQLTEPVGSSAVAPVVADPADLLIQRETARPETMLRSNAYGLRRQQRNLPAAVDSLSRPDEWLVERSTLLFTTSVDRSDAVQGIVRLLATFKQGEIAMDLLGKARTILFAGNDRRQRAMDTSMLLKRLGVKHSGPVPLRENGEDKEQILMEEA